MNHVSLDSVGIGPVARARAIGPAISAAADEIERSQTIPELLLSHIHDARLARILLPRSAGGDELEPWTYLHAIEEISRHDGSVGWNLFVANSAALIAPFIPLETAQAIFTDARAWVSWGPPNQYQAHSVPGGYRVSGEWHFASGSRQATQLGVGPWCGGPRGGLAAPQPLRAPHGPDAAVSQGADAADPGLEHDRHAGHRVRRLPGHRPVRPRSLQRHPGGSVAAPRR